jgi:hypothetical protein
VPNLSITIRNFPIAVGALRQLRSRGWRSLLRNPATFHLSPLHEYTQPAVYKGRARGVFRVVRPLAEADRRRIGARCDALLAGQGQHPYDLLFTNCESAAFHVCHDARLGERKISPQV